MVHQGSHSFAYKKYQDISMTFQDAQNVFQDSVVVQQCLNTQTAITNSVHIV